MKKRLITAATFATGALTLLAGCAVVDPVSRLTIATLMEDQSDPDYLDINTNPVEITDATCGADLNCVEAWSTDEANYYRFASRRQAAAYTATLDDGFATHFIVMDFAGKTASAETQQWAMERLAGTWQDYQGPYPDRR